MVNENRVTPAVGQATIGQESETGRGWIYGLTIRWENGVATEHSLSLSWTDHESIAGGQVRPSVLAAAVAGIMMETQLDLITDRRLPARLDVSTVRRLIDGFDEAVRARLG